MELVREMKLVLLVNSCIKSLALDSGLCAQDYARVGERGFVA